MVGAEALKSSFAQRLNLLMWGKTSHCDDRGIKAKQTQYVTSAELAREIGVQQSVVRKWRTAERLPTIEKIYDCAVYFDVPIDYLLGRTWKGLSDRQLFRMCRSNGINVKPKLKVEYYFQQLKNMEVI